MRNIFDDLFIIIVGVWALLILGRMLYRHRLTKNIRECLAIRRRHTLGIF